MASYKGGLPYSADVAFYGDSAPNFSPNTVRVMQAEFAHDVAVMEFWGADVTAGAFVSGTPMILTFGRPTTRRTFVGYVNHPARTNNALTSTSLTQRNAAIVYCVGASWYMKQSGTQSWHTQTGSQIVQSVATGFGLAADIVPDTTVWATVQMAGMTYWQLCVMLAKRIGYTFYCNGVQLVFKPRQTNPNSLTGPVALYDYRADPANFPIFTPVLGKTSPSGGELAIRQQGGIDPRTGNVVFSQVSGSPAPSLLGGAAESPVFTRVQHEVVSTQQEAVNKTEGAGLENQMYLAATAKASGNPLVAQGSLIFVQNANGSENGLWYVKQAEHLMNTSTYAMDLSLGRDSLGSTNTIGGVPQNSSPVVPTLINNCWVAVAA
jgi:phage protein D